MTAVTNDGAGHAWGRLLQWRDADNRTHRWAMPAAMLAGDGTDIRARLLEGGLFVAPNRKAWNMLGVYLGRSAPAERVRVVPRIGWHDLPGGRLFCCRTARSAAPERRASCCKPIGRTACRPWRGWEPSKPGKRRAADPSARGMFRALAMRAVNNANPSFRDDVAACASPLHWNHR